MRRLLSKIGFLLALLIALSAIVAFGLRWRALRAADVVATQIADIEAQLHAPATRPSTLRYRENFLREIDPQPQGAQLLPLYQSDTSKLKQQAAIDAAEAAADMAELDALQKAIAQELSLRQQQLALIPQLDSANRNAHRAGTFALLGLPWCVALIGMSIALRALETSFRARNGLCVKCRYDLRASADRCPECGTQTHRANPNLAECVLNSPRYDAPHDHALRTDHSGL